MTYTLLVLLAALLAKGRARGPGRAGPRALLAAGIMLAPQLSATQILLLSPDHTGTAVPVLVTWLVIDRVTPDRWKAARWLVPLVVFVLLTWTMVGRLDRADHLHRAAGAGGPRSVPVRG